MRARLVPLWLVAAAILVPVDCALAGDGLVVLHTADPGCPTFSSGEIFVPCGNGTVTDNRTGLVWLAKADCIVEAGNWREALTFVAGLSDLPEGACGPGVDPDDCDCGLSDGSSAGEWRLPSLGEWQQMIEGAEEMGCRTLIQNDLGTACWSEVCYDVGLCSFHGVWAHAWGRFWSSSPAIILGGPFTPDEPAAWFVSVRPTSSGVFNRRAIEDGRLIAIWPVRDGR